jgi:transposase
VERGYSVAEVAERLGVSGHSLHKCVKAVKPSKTDAQAAELNDAKKEILKLRAQLRRAEEERDILKKQRPTSPRTRREVRVHREASRDLASTTGH